MFYFGYNDINIGGAGMLAIVGIILVLKSIRSSQQTALLCRENAKRGLIHASYSSGHDFESLCSEILNSSVDLSDPLPIDDIELAEYNKVNRPYVGGHHFSDDFLEYNISEAVYDYRLLGYHHFARIRRRLQGQSVPSLVH